MTAPERMRVLVGEDQPIVCEGIVRILERGGFEVAGTAADAPELVRKASLYHPDVVVTDIQMPPDHTDDGLRAAIQIRAAEPGTGVLVLSQFLEDRYAFDLVAGGARGTGYLLKEKGWHRAAGPASADVAFHGIVDDVRRGILVHGAWVRHA